MRPSCVVLDTSALLESAEASRVGWREALLHLQTTYPFASPTLLASEAGNVIHRKRPAAYGRDAQERAELLEVLLLDIELVPTDAAARRLAGDLAAELALSFYDAEFLALAAQREGSVLLTQDGQLLRAAKAKLGAPRGLTPSDAEALIADGSL